MKPLMVSRSNQDPDPDLEGGAMPVRVVTDSTSDLPPELAEAQGITVVPLNVQFGEETYRDGVDISPDQFYQRLVSSPRLPTTSQPSVGAFIEAYQGVAEGAEGIVSVHISAKLSGTCNSATQAQTELASTVPIEVVDTRQASLATGLVALAAARAAQAGASLAEVAEEARKASGEVSVFFMVDTLEYLQKGGRIGKAAAFLGGLLNVKPLLTIRDGEVHPLERARTRRKAVARLLELVRQAAPVRELAVMHSTTPEDAEELARQVAPLLSEGQVLTGRLGSVVGTYAGPGMLGVGLRRAG
jgi:DegV family protein with EDD domain